MVQQYSVRKDWCNSTVLVTIDYSSTLLVKNGTAVQSCKAYTLITRLVSLGTLIYDGKDSYINFALLEEVILIYPELRNVCFCQ